MRRGKLEENELDVCILIVALMVSLTCFALQALVKSWPKPIANRRGGRLPSKVPKMISWLLDKEYEPDWSGIQAVVHDPRSRGHLSGVEVVLLNLIRKGRLPMVCSHILYLSNFRLENFVDFRQNLGSPISEIMVLRRRMKEAAYHV